jgi:hypothetical protein
MCKYIIILTLLHFSGETMMKFSVFANTIQKCNTILKPHRICLTEIMMDKDKSILDNVVNLLVGLIGMQVRN